MLRKRRKKAKVSGRESSDHASDMAQRAKDRDEVKIRDEDKEVL